MRWPVRAASISTISSRSMKPYSSGVSPPRSSASQPMNRPWLAIRLSSQTRVRMYCARRGTWRSSSFSAAMTGIASLNSDATYSSGSHWLIAMCQSPTSHSFSTPRCR